MVWWSRRAIGFATPWSRPPWSAGKLPMEGLLFALIYAWRNLRRGGSRSIFAAFCVAVGVAAVVGMQMLALNISAAVDRAPKEANGGDIAVDPIAAPFRANDLAAVAALRQR